MYAKMKELGPTGGRAPGMPPLDPPMPMSFGSVDHGGYNINMSTTSLPMAFSEVVFKVKNFADMIFTKINGHGISF